MRILTVTAYFDSHRGGIEIVAGQLARELGSRGHEVSWAASNQNAQPAGWVRAVGLPVVNVIERLTGLPLPIPTPGGIGKLILAVRAADAVIVHDALYFTSMVALLAARFAARPVLLIQHIGEIPFGSRWLAGLMRLANRLVTRPMLGAADQVVFISETTQRHFSKVRFKRPPVLAFNGVDSTIFRPAHPESREALRRAFGYRPADSIVLFVGRFVEKKGLAILREIAAARPNLVFALAGWGPIDPIAWGLPNVRVFGGLSGARLAELYQASDIFILPSTGEGFPLVLQEALACGLPIVCGSESADADPAAKPFLHGNAVDLADPAGTAQRFAAAIDQALASQPDHCGPDFARQRYAWTATAQIYEGILAELTTAGTPEQRLCLDGSGQ